MKICSVEVCHLPAYAKGHCKSHYYRAKRGAPMDTPIPEKHQTRPLADRLWEKVNRNAGNGCWEWTGHINRKGYGWMRVDGGTGFAHRAAWEIEHNVKLAPQEELDHLCHNTKCVNPRHLRVTDRWGNTQNLTGKRTNNTSGHRNVYWSKGKSKWEVKVNAFKVTHHGGYFTDKAEAVEVAAKLRSEVLPRIPEMKP